MVAICGTGFFGTLTVLVGGGQCSNVMPASRGVWTNNTVQFPSATCAMIITCTLPSGVGQLVSVNVENGFHRQSPPVPAVSYAPPSMQALIGCSNNDTLVVTNCSRAGGDQLVVHVQGFGAGLLSVVCA